MSLREEIVPYLTKDAMIANLPGGSSNNDLRYSSEYFLQLYRRNELTSEDIDHFITIISLVRVVGTQALFHTSPGNDTKHVTHDDYILIAACAQKIAPEIAEDIVDQGESSFWLFNNVRPGWPFSLKSWFLRMPHNICHFYFCDPDRKPSQFLKYIWCLNILISANKPKTNQDAWVLTHYLVESARGKDKMCDDWIAYWEKKKESKKIIIGDILNSYFGIIHPIGKNFKERRTNGS